MTCTGLCIALELEKYYYFHYFSQKRDVKLLLCMERNLLSVCGNGTRRLCLFVRYPTLLVIPAASQGVWHHCCRKTIGFRVRERMGTLCLANQWLTPVPCYRVFTLCFFGVQKTPSSPVFLLQCQPSLGDQQ